MERERDLGTQNRVGLPRLALQVQAVGQKDHRRDTDPAPQQQPLRPLRMQAEGLADGPQHAQGVTLALLREGAGAVPHHLVEELHPASFAIDTLDRQGTPHRQARGAL